MDPVLVGTSLTKKYGGFTALNDVSFELHHGKTLGIVGESGSGKSTLGRIIMRLLKPTSGSIQLAGSDFFRLSGGALKKARQRIQLVPQDPRTSLNPTMSVKSSLQFQLSAQAVPRANWTETLERTLDQVSLPMNYLNAMPNELSGGQAQRIAIARAILNNPEVLVCDEAVSALDKSVQAQVLNTLSNLQRDTGVAMVFISHDLAVVEHMADTMLVLKQGQVVEYGTTRDILDNPSDEYTRTLLAARSLVH